MVNVLIMHRLCKLVLLIALLVPNSSGMTVSSPSSLKMDAWWKICLKRCFMVSDESLETTFACLCSNPGFLDICKNTSLVVPKSSFYHYLIKADRYFSKLIIVDYAISSCNTILTKELELLKTDIHPSVLASAKIMVNLLPQLRIIFALYHWEALESIRYYWSELKSLAVSPAKTHSFYRAFLLKAVHSFTYDYLRATASTSSHIISQFVEEYPSILTLDPESIRTSSPLKLLLYICLEQLQC